MCVITSTSTPLPTSLLFSALFLPSTPLLTVLPFSVDFEFIFQGCQSRLEVKGLTNNTVWRRKYDNVYIAENQKKDSIRILKVVGITTQQLKFKGRFYWLKPELPLQSCYFQIKSRSRRWGEELCPCLPWQPVPNPSGWGLLFQEERGLLVLQHSDGVGSRVTWQLIQTLLLEFRFSGSWPRIYI